MFNYYFGSVKVRLCRVAPQCYGTAGIGPAEPEGPLMGCSKEKFISKVSPTKKPQERHVEKIQKSIKKTDMYRQT